jgi:hypothetical protein
VRSSIDANSLKDLEASPVAPPITNCYFKQQQTD